MPRSLLRGNSLWAKKKQTRSPAEYAVLPPSSKQIPVLVLAAAELGGGVLARMRPFIGNVGTVPAMDISASCNCGDFGQAVFEGGLTRDSFQSSTWKNWASCTW